MTEVGPATIHNTMGASLIGVICAGILYGVSCVQTWFYFSRYPKDVWYIKGLVITVWVFDSIHQGLISHTVYHYLITNFGNFPALDDIVWSILLEVLFNVAIFTVLLSVTKLIFLLKGLVGLLVQSFLTLRVWRLSNHNISLTALTAGFVLGEFACSVVFTIQSLQLTTWAQLKQLKALSMTVNVLAAFADALIAGALCFFLQRSRTGFKKSDTMITKLTLFAVSTGFLTTLCALASLLSIAVWEQTLIYVAFYFSLGRLYSNSVLATLNARQAIRELGEDSENLTFSLQPTFLKSGPMGFNSNRTTNISIKIDTSQQCIHDPTRPEQPDSATVTTDSSYKDASL